MSDRQISVETLIDSYRTELSTTQQRLVEANALINALERANGELLEEVRQAKGEKPDTAADDPAEPQDRAKANGKASARR